MDAPLYTADEALRRLKAGNERFLRGEARFPTVRKETLADLASGQSPYATILGCSDSRVPPELIFDAISESCSSFGLLEMSFPPRSWVASNTPVRICARLCSSS